MAYLPWHRTMSPFSYGQMVPLDGMGDLGVKKGLGPGFQFYTYLIRRLSRSLHSQWQCSLGQQGQAHVVVQTGSSSQRR